MKTLIEVRPLHVIAREIKLDWKNVNYGAKPYLDVLLYSDKVTDSVGCENAKTQVLYFLSNASTWRGETAKRIKAELNKMIK